MFTLAVIPAHAQSGTTLYSIEDSPIWRVQLLVTTADVWGGSTWGGGGTNDQVKVRLNWENATALYTSFNNRDNFERGRTHIYDLVLDNVRKLRDIEMIQISKPGSDAWCIQGLTLLVNGRAIYDNDFPGNGHWMGTNAMLYALYPSLRAHPLWRSYTLPPVPQAIWGGELIGRIDGYVGDLLLSPGLQAPSTHMWDPAGAFAYSVRVNGNGPRMVRVELDLRYAYSVIYQQGYVEFKPRFDLEFSCSGGALWVQTRNLDMTDYLFFDPVTAADYATLTTFLQMTLPMRITAAFQTVRYTNEQGQAACPPIRVVGNSVYLW